MHYIYCLILCLLIFVVHVDAYSNINSQNYYNSYSSPIVYNSGRYYNPTINELTMLEKYAFENSYEGENALMRLQRLELQAFGAIQQGTFDSRYEKVRAAILSRPKAHTNSSVWRNIGNYFSGQMTGFTPPIHSQYNNAYFNNSPFYYVPSNYGNTSVTNYSSPLGARGIMFKSHGTSTGGGITILD